MVDMIAIMIDSSKDEYLTIYDTGKTKGGASATYIADKSKLKDKKIGKLYIQSCNTGMIDYNENVASVFVDNYSIDEVIAWDGGTGYTKYLYFDTKGNPQTYYHIRLSHNQYSFYKYVKSLRSAQGRVKYTKDNIEMLGNSFLSHGTVIDGKQIKIGPH